MKTYSTALRVALLLVFLWGPEIASAEIDATCSRCKKWFVLSKSGAGYKRKYDGLCPACESAENPDSSESKEGEGGAAKEEDDPSEETQGAADDGSSGASKKHAEEFLVKAAQIIGDWISGVFGPPGPLHLPNEQDRQAIEGLTKMDQGLVATYLLSEGKTEEALRVRRMSKREYQEFMKTPEGQRIASEYKKRRN